MHKEIDGIEMRIVESPLVDGFTDEYLTVLAGPDGAGDAPHKYLVLDKQGRVVTGFAIQEGNPKEVGVNGVGNQTLLLICLDFLKKIQAGQFSCRENSLQVTKIEEALLWSKARELDRLKRGVYQTHQK